MFKQKLIAQGAEAKIFLSKDIIIKNRIPKSYRLPELDNKIRKRRTKSETKLLTKASKIINTPLPIVEPKSKNHKTLIKSLRKIMAKPDLKQNKSASNSEQEIHQIKIPYIKGKKLSEHLNKFSLTEQKSILKQIGQSVAKLHNANIIHGDLTTSNMILSIPSTTLTPPKKNLSLNKSSAKKSGKADFEAINPRAKGECIYFIDFGLGFISQKFEDKAVDIHLLRQALEAKHFENWEKLFAEFLKEYQKYHDSKIVLERLKAVEKRGRYKG